MKEKVFFKLFIALFGVCAVITIAHIIYIAYAYDHCSIIQFIAKELW